MLLRSVFLKTTADHSRLIKTGAAVLGLFSILLVTAYELISRLENLPVWLAAAAAFFQGLPGAQVELPAGWVLETAWFLLIPTLLAVFSIELGARLLAGPDGPGELELLLAYPLSRSRLMLEKFSVLVVATAALGSLAWLLAGLGFLAAGAVPMELGLWLGMVLLALVFGSLAFALSGRTGSRVKARWITLGVLLLAVVLELFGQALPAPLAFLQYLSPLYDYAAGHLLSGVVRPGFTLLLAALAGLLLGLAAVGFDRREIG